MNIHFLSIYHPEQRPELETLEYIESEAENKMGERSHVRSKKHFAITLSDSYNNIKYALKVRF